MLECEWATYITHSFFLSKNGYMWYNVENMLEEKGL